jgi:hypothetical protein
MSLRRVEVPDGAPPYDCEAHGAACPAVRSVASGAHEAGGGARPGLGAPARSGLASRSVAGSRSVAAPGSRSVAAPGSRSVAAPGSRSGLGGAAAGGTGPAEALPWQFAQVMVEIMAGLRPQKQLIGLTTERARAQVQRLAPLLASDRQPRIARIVTSRPTARVLEMTVVVRVGTRSRALAVRLEHLAERPATPGRPARPARWLCTAVEAG